MFGDELRTARARHGAVHPDDVFRVNQNVKRAPRQPADLASAGCGLLRRPPNHERDQEPRPQVLVQVSA
jgi:hypothetical protein